MRAKIGVMAHMFHEALFEPVKQQLLHISEKADLHLTTCSEENAAILHDLFADWNGAVEVYQVTNRGRDIAPKLLALRHAHARYDLVLHLHTKASHDEWREHIYRCLLQSEEHVGRVLKTFEKFPRLGMLGGEHYPGIVPWLGWGSNLPTAVDFLARMDVNPAHIAALDFPSGSMFWARPAALRPLFDLDLSLNEFEPEPLGKDGSVAHAIERLFYISCEVAGFNWGKISESGKIKIRNGLQKLYCTNRLMRLLKVRKNLSMAAQSL